MTLKRHVFVGFFVFLVAFGGLAPSAQAQWTAGFNLMPSVQPTGLNPEIGQIRAIGSVSSGSAGSTNLNLGTTDSPIQVEYPTGRVLAFNFGFKPMNGPGAEFRYWGYQTDGSLSGALDAVQRVPGGIVLNQVRYFGNQDLTPLVRSSGAVDFGPYEYHGTSGSKLRRLDFNGTFGFGRSPGRATLFAGLAMVNIDNARVEGQQRKLFFHSNSPIGILEENVWKADSAMNYRGIGPQGGAEGEVCLFNFLLFHGRAGVAMLMGNAIGTGAWSWTKTGSLGPAAQSVRGALGTPLFVVRSDTPLDGSERANVFATELEGSIGVEFARRFQVGVGVWSQRFDNMPVASSWIVPQAAAPEKGHWQQNKAAVALQGLMLRFSARF